jgi:hypothetical protein
VDGNGAASEALPTATVVLERPTRHGGFGFGLAETNDGRLFVFKISSNIYNWGMLQVGDVILRVDGVTTTGMGSERAEALIHGGLKTTLEVVRNAESTAITHTVRGKPNQPLPCHWLPCCTDGRTLGHSGASFHHAKLGFCARLDSCL